MICCRAMDHYYADYTHSLCVDIQKWISEKGFAWRVMEEYNYFTVTSNKGCVRVYPVKGHVELQSDDISVKLPYKVDTKGVLQSMLL